MLVKIKKCKNNTKKLIKNSEKIFRVLREKINDFCLLQFFYKVDSICKKLFKTNIWQFLIINISLTIA